MFRVVSSPIVRSTHNCIYSIWYLLTVTATCLYCGRVGAGLNSQTPDISRNKKKKSAPLEIFGLKMRTYMGKRGYTVALHIV